jgi:hypothetical protein
VIDLEAFFQSLLLVAVGAFVVLGGLAVWLVGRLTEPAPAEASSWACPPSSPGCAPTRSEMLSERERAARPGPAGGDRAVIEAAYRQLATLHHPDKGGDPAVMRRLTAARGSSAPATVTWAARRARYWTTHERRCARCGSPDEVVLHHLTYRWSLGEEPDDALVPLCRRHHLELHQLHAVVFVEGVEPASTLPSGSTQRGRVVPSVRAIGRRFVEVEPADRCPRATP